MRRVRRSPWLPKSRSPRKMFVFLIFRPPVFDTTSPGVGGRLKPRVARHGNLTPPRIAPSCPQAGVPLCTDEVMAKQLVRCFWPDGYRSPPYLAVFDGGESPQAGLGASSSVAYSSGNVFQSPDVTGLARCFSMSTGGKGQPPHYLSRFVRGLHEKIFSVPSFFLICAGRRPFGNAASCDVNRVYLQPAAQTSPENTAHEA